VDFIASLLPMTQNLMSDFSFLTPLAIV